MARRAKRAERPLPPPLPPAERTVGQLVGEAIRLYGANFLQALPLGVPVVAVNALAWSNSSGAGRLGLVLAAALLISLSYVGAVALVTGAPLRSRSALLAYAIGVLVFLPFPVLVTIFVLPGLAWLALVGLSVPAALVEHLGFAPRSSAGLDSGEPTTSTCSAVSRRSHSSSSSRSSACTSCFASRGEHAARRDLHSRRSWSRRSSSSAARSSTSTRRLV